MSFKTIKKIGLGLAVFTGTASVVVGIKYGLNKRAIRTGKVDTWIKEVLGDTSFEINPTIKVPAYTTEDQSKVYFRLSDDDLMQISGTLYSLKTTIQSVAAHEKGHIIDTELASIQRAIYKAMDELDYETYRSQAIRREKRAWKLGRQFISNKKAFDKFNMNNIKVYEKVIRSEKSAFTKGAN